MKGGGTDLGGDRRRIFLHREGLSARRRKPRSVAISGKKGGKGEGVYRRKKKKRKKGRVRFSKEDSRSDRSAKEREGKGGGEEWAIFVQKKY